MSADAPPACSAASAARPRRGRSNRRGWRWPVECLAEPGRADRTGANDGHRAQAEIDGRVDAIAHGTGLVVEHDDRISGYASDLGFAGHAVGEADADLKALILAADAFHGSGILVPTTNGELFRWCLGH